MKVYKRIYKLGNQCTCRKALNARKKKWCFSIKCSCSLIKKNALKSLIYKFLVEDPDLTCLLTIVYLMLYKWLLGFRTSNAKAINSIASTNYTLTIRRERKLKGTLNRLHYRVLKMTKFDIWNFQQLVYKDFRLK